MGSRNRRPKEGEKGYLANKSDSDSAMEDSSEGSEEDDGGSSDDGESGSSDEGDAVGGEMEDEAEERDKEEAEDVPLLPLVEHTIQAVESDEFQKLLQSCGIKRPSAGEQYWRIPAKVRGAVLRTIAIVIRRGLEGNWEGLLEGLDEAHLNRGAKK